ncbi:hypothetical protein FPV67DRAFT_1450225 [Lyophyllum atratum]|nr:hypothetical protein FPV67DRAFT_1450225 [Lyophyllum atratum]
MASHLQLRLDLFSRGGSCTSGFHGLLRCLPLGRITGFSATNSLYTVSFTIKTEEDETVVLDVPYHYTSLSAKDFLTHSSRITTPHHEFDVDLHKRVEAMIRKGRERDASSPHKAPAVSDVD